MPMPDKQRHARGVRLMVALFGLLAGCLCIPAMAIELRYLHGHQAKYDSKGIAPAWTVSGETLRGDRGLRLSAAGKECGGYVMLGQYVVLPAALADARVALEYRCSLPGTNWRAMPWHLGFVFMTEQAWDRLATSPEQAGTMNLHTEQDWIYHVQLSHLNQKPGEWTRTLSPDFAPALQDYLGETLVAAVIWGTNEAGKPSCALRGLDLHFLDAEEARRDFLDAFSGDWPGLEVFAAARELGDIEGAEAALLAYYRKRSEPNLSGMERELHQDWLRYADLATEGVFYAPATGVPPVEVARERLWVATPEDQEQWAVAINRHALWNWLAAAHREDPEAGYLAEFERQLLDWDRSMPVAFGRFFTEGFLDRFGRLPLWLNAGLRMGDHWFWVFEDLKGEMSDEALLTMLRWMREHGRYLANPLHFNPESNWGAMANNGLAHVSLMLPELKRSGEWFETADARLAAMLEQQVYPDGVQKELTPGYHRITINKFVSTLRLARGNGRELGPQVEGTIEKMYEALARIMAPDLATPDLNDSIRIGSEILKDALDLFPDNPNFRYLASGRKEGHPPDFLSTTLPWAGWRVMRSGWEAEDTFLLFDSGPLGVSHYHDDNLHFVLHGGGERLIRDFGFYPYDNSPWLHYARSAFSHNTVLVDGRPQARGRKPQAWLETVDVAENGEWATHSDFDYARGRYRAGWRGADGSIVQDPEQVREILFLKPRLFLLQDRFLDDAEARHEYETLFHLDGEDVRLSEGEKKVWLYKGNSVLEISALWPLDMRLEIIKGQKEPGILGWKKTDTIGALLPLPVLVGRFPGSGDARAVWGMRVLEAGEGVAAMEEECSLTGEQGEALRVRLPDQSMEGVVELGSRGERGMRFVGRAQNRDIIFPEASVVSE